MYFLANDEALVGGRYTSTNNNAWETMFLDTVEKWNNKADSHIKL